MFPVSSAGKQTHKSLQLPKTLGPYNISLNKLLHIPIKFLHLGGGYSDVSGTFR